MGAPAPAGMTWSLQRLMDRLWAAKKSAPRIGLVTSASQKSWTYSLLLASLMVLVILPLVLMEVPLAARRGEGLMSGRPMSLTGIGTTLSSAPVSTKKHWPERWSNKERIVDRF